MAVTDATPLIAENLNDTAEIEQARQLSARYRCPFLDLREQSDKGGTRPQHSGGIDVPLQLCAARA